MAEAAREQAEQRHWTVPFWDFLKPVGRTIDDLDDKKVGVEARMYMYLLVKLIEEIVGLRKAIQKRGK